MSLPIAIEIGRIVGEWLAKNVGGQKIPGVNEMTAAEWQVVRAYSGKVPRHGVVPFDLVDYIWRVESLRSLRPTVGKFGEVGPMQVNPSIMAKGAAAWEYDFKGPYTLRGAAEHLSPVLNNFLRGTAYLARWYNFFNKRTDLATSALLATQAYRSPTETLNWFNSGFKTGITSASFSRGRLYDKHFNTTIFKDLSKDTTLIERIGEAVKGGAEVTAIVGFGALALVLLVFFLKR